MSKPTKTLGGRLPLADPAALTGAQRELFNKVNATQVPWASKMGFQATTADGRLIGPYNSFLLHPEVAAKILEFSAAEKTHPALSQRRTRALPRRSTDHHKPRWAKQLILRIAQHAWVSAAHVCDVGTFRQVGLIS